MAIKEMQLPGQNESTPVGLQVFDRTLEEWNNLSLEEKRQYDYVVSDEDDEDTGGFADRVLKKDGGEQSVNKDFAIVFDDNPSGGLKFVGGIINGFQPGVGWILDDGYNYPGQVPDVPMVKKAIDAEMTPYAKLFYGGSGETPPTSITHPDNVNVKVGTYRIMVANGGSFRIFKCTQIDNENITWAKQGGIHKPTMYRLNEDNMSELSSVQDWCEWIYNHITTTNDDDYYGSIGHLEFYADNVVFSNSDSVSYTGYMTCYLTRATDWGGDYCLHGYGTDDAGNVFKIWGNDYDEVDPNSAKLYAEKLGVEAERSVINLVPFMNTNIVERINEYVRATVTGKTAIIDFGGVCFKSAANGQYLMSNLPFKIKNRAVIQIFTDLSQATAVSNGYCTVYANAGQNSIMVHTKTNNPYYGQMVVELI